jgi:energy-coupling factor transporter ATP-binding protein EcfA2
MKKVSLFKLLHGLYHAKLPVMVFGKPGIGKSSIIKQLSDVLEVHNETIIANKSDPTDFSGIPYLDTLVEEHAKEKDVVYEQSTISTKVLKYAEPRYVTALKQNSNSILFVDEITTCSHPVQTALLSIILDCKFGEFEIPKTTFRIAAGNYNSTVGTNSLSQALMNRFIHIFFEPDIEEFSEGFLSGFNNYEKAIINSQEEVNDKIVYYKNAVINFLKDNPEFLSQEPQEFVEKEDVAFTTPRTWDMCVQALAHLDQNGKEFIEVIIKGSVGKAVYSLFNNYLNSYKGLEVNIPDFVGKEDKFKFPNPDRHDKVCQITANIMYYFYKDKKKYEKLMFTCMRELKENNFDTLVVKYLVNAVQSLIDANMYDRKTAIKQIEAYKLREFIYG